METEASFSKSDEFPLPIVTLDVSEKDSVVAENDGTAGELGFTRFASRVFMVNMFVCVDWNMRCLEVLWTVWKAAICHVFVLFRGGVNIITNRK